MQEVADPPRPAGPAGVVTGETDGELARRICRGDGAAWERFFDRYASWAYRFAYRHLGGNHADAQDLCSDILIAAARGLHHYDARIAPLDFWLLGVARHRLSGFCRGRRLQMPVLVDLEEIADLADDPLQAPSDRVHTSDIVNRALAGLPLRQAAALVGKYVLGYSTEELAHREHCTPKAMENLLARGRASFRRAFLALQGAPTGGSER